jgi:hypothetical protein
VREVLKDGSNDVALVPGPSVAMFLFVGAAIVSAVLALLAHQRAKGDLGRPSYVEVKQRLRRDLKI